MTAAYFCYQIDGVSIEKYRLSHRSFERLEEALRDVSHRLEKYICSIARGRLAEYQLKRILRWHEAKCFLCFIFVLFL